MEDMMQDVIEECACDEAATRLEKIRKRAYELYELGGCEDGHDLEHWQQAEAELSATPEE